MSILNNEIVCTNIKNTKGNSCPLTMYLHILVDSCGNPSQTFIANYDIKCESDIEDKDPPIGTF